MKTLTEAEKKQTPLEKLIYEYRKGKPIYYKNYKEVLKGKLSPEEVMESSSLHALLVALITAYLVRELTPKNHLILSGELGYSPEKGTLYNLDIAVFKKESLQKEGITNKLVKTPPEAVIEIDTKADTEKFGGFEAYMFTKTQDLLDSGVKTVIWYLTKEKKVLYAQKGKDWIITNWDKDLPVAEGVSLNLQKLLREFGINL